MCSWLGKGPAASSRCLVGLQIVRLIFFIQFSFHGGGGGGGESFLFSRRASSSCSGVGLTWIVGTAVKFSSGAVVEKANFAPIPSKQSGEKLVTAKMPRNWLPVIVFFSKHELNPLSSQRFRSRKLVKTNVVCISIITKHYDTTLARISFFLFALWNSGQIFIFVIHNAAFLHAPR